MEKELQLRESDEMARDVEVAEATFSRQTEDHTLPARQVLCEQQDSVSDGLESYAFIP